MIFVFRFLSPSELRKFIMFSSAPLQLVQDEKKTENQVNQGQFIVQSRKSRKKKNGRTRGCVWRLDTPSPPYFKGFSFGLFLLWTRPTASVSAPWASKAHKGTSRPTNQKRVGQPIRSKHTAKLRTRQTKDQDGNKTRTRTKQ